MQDITGGYTQYIYDADGGRVAKGSVTSLSCDSTTNGFSPTNSYVVGSGGEQVTEFARQGSTWAWSHSNVFGSGGSLATYTGSDTYFAFKDWLGTKRVELTPDGLSTVFASLPFGDGLTSSGTAADATEQHFTGKERDAESGLDYFGARYYASNMGRWMSPDWSSTPTGVPYAQLDNPQSLNLYGYAGNNPLSRADPDGHTWEEFKNWWNWGHYVNNAGLEGALQKEADEDRKDIAGLKNVSINGKSPGDALNGLNNKQTIQLERGITNFLQAQMFSGAPLQVALALETSGDSEIVLSEAALAGKAQGITSELYQTPGGRIYSAHYLNDTGAVRNIPGSVVDETIDHATSVQKLSDRTVYYDSKNDVTVVKSDTSGKIMSARRGQP